MISFCSVDMILQVMYDDICDLFLPSREFKCKEQDYKFTPLPRAPGTVYFTLCKLGNCGLKFNKMCSISIYLQYEYFAPEHLEDSINSHKIDLLLEEFYYFNILRNNPDAQASGADPS